MAVIFALAAAAVAACGGAATTPSTDPAGSTAPPSAPGFSADERQLLDGIVRGAVDCRPVREELPDRAIAGIECGADDPAVDRIGFYRFENDDDMLDVYFARMIAEGVAPNSGTCGDGEGEGPYWPGGDEVPAREGCFLNDFGYANYRATLPGEHVYIGVLGRTNDMAALESFAWLGNRDTPGTPTLWAEPR